MPKASLNMFFLSLSPALGLEGPVTLDDSGDIDNIMCLLYVSLDTRKVCLTPENVGWQDEVEEDS